MTESLPSCDPASSGCGCGAAVKFDGAIPAYRRILMAVIAINGAAFLAIAGGAALQGSASLGANALDFLADAATYGISLAVIGRSVAVRSGAAMIKGASLAALALFILGYAIWRATTGAAPEGFIITGLGALGFFANALAALLLVRHREGDANVRSVWLCTRNDLIQSLVVAGTGLAVWVTASRWPDLIAGAILAVVFLQSGWSIIRQSREERKVAA
ncbi:MAG: cation transporter [Caulobacterales bacterium GWE1_67_11]|uniref:cation transporter n=1 Tax=Brevundimonas sp. EAKA TaxID=1495854 RepID=UPI0005565779|nr:cation transporter [Brevundimonas sp. EAKA]OGN40861.1 MAG: cation transporter [Caulobacterales bacterium GWE1_67_11]